MLLKEKFLNDLIGDGKNCYSIKRIYDDNNKLALVQVLNSKGGIYKVLFYDDLGRLSNMSVYDQQTGRETKNITYKSDGKTVSSVREYDSISKRLLNVSFFRPDGISISSIIEYDVYGKESNCSLFCDDGEVIKFKI